MDNAWTNSNSHNNRKHQNFIENQHYCALCGSPLEIKVISLIYEDMVQEEAHCHSCKIKARIKDHKIQ